LPWNTSYIIVNRLISTFQNKFNHANPYSHSWDIRRQSFYSYWWPDINISVIHCHFYTSHIYMNSPHLGLSSATQFVRIGLLVVEIQAEWNLWHFHTCSIFKCLSPFSASWSLLPHVYISHSWNTLVSILEVLVWFSNQVNLILHILFLFLFSNSDVLL